MTTVTLAFFALMGWAGASLVSYKPNPDDPDPWPWPGPWPGPWPWWRNRLFGALGGIALGYALSSNLGAENLLVQGVAALAGGIFFRDLGSGLGTKRNLTQK